MDYTDGYLEEKKKDKKKITIIGDTNPSNGELYTVGYDPYKEEDEKNVVTTRTSLYVTTNTSTSK